DADARPIGGVGRLAGGQRRQHVEARRRAAAAAGQQQQADERDDDGQRLEGTAHGRLRVQRLPVSKEFGLLRRKSASARIEIAADLNSRKVEVTSLSIAGFRATSRCRVSTSV